MIEPDASDFARCFADEPPTTAPGADLARGRAARRARSHRRIGGAVAAVAAATLLVTLPPWGAGTQLAVPAGTPGPRATSTIQPSWPGCTDHGAFAQPDGVGPPPGAGRVPEDFTPVEVRRCSRDLRTSDTGDQVWVELEQEAAVTPELLDYLARPSVEPDPVQACRAWLWIPPWLVLLDQDGRYVVPVLPTDGCQHPLTVPGTDELPYESLPYRDVSAREGDVLESAAARRAGCPMNHKNMLAVVPPGPTTAPVDPTVFAGSTVRRCDYAVDDPASGDSGTFTGGGDLDTDKLATLLADVVSADQTCRTEAARFTVIRADRSPATLYLELDGCRRALQE